MSRLRTPKPVKPMIAVFSADRAKLAAAVRRAEEIIGRIDYASLEFLFDHTGYYHAEMGEPLYKRFFSSETLIDPAGLADIKIRCTALETEWTEGGKRSVNIDPGYVSAERVVLTTGKNYAHRIYLGGGVYADLTLIYEKGGFRTLPWTYPDYAAPETQAAMLDIRKKYLDQLRSMQGEDE